jgi:hypothetical protein
VALFSLNLSLGPLKQWCQATAKESIHNSNFISRWYKMYMAKRKMYNTTLDAGLIRQIKILAAKLEKRQNDLLEEAIEDLLKKYEAENER